MTANRYCDALKIEVPSLEAVVHHREATSYSLLLVALLERGEAMTLAEVAERLSTTGAGPAATVLQALKKCRPARPPVYRDGERYALDPHDDELDLWAFRLGLRPPKVARLPVVRSDQTPLPGVDHALTVSELQEAWKGKDLVSWSAQRVAVAVLDAHGAPMLPQDVVAFVAALTEWHRLRADAHVYWRANAVHVRDDGRWENNQEHEALPAARKAVRDRIAMERKWAGLRHDPIVAEATRRAVEARREAHAAELATLRRAILVAFPARNPRAAALFDTGNRTVVTYVDDELTDARARLREYDVVCAVNVREVLRQLGLDPEAWRLVELGPPQKSVALNRRGRSLKITIEMLITGSCGINKPLSDPTKMAGYLAKGHLQRLRAHLEADATSLYSLFSYGRLHGNVRLRWGGLDETFVAPWLHRDEEFLYPLLSRANTTTTPLEVVVGCAPDWSAPWARMQRCTVLNDDSLYEYVVVDERGYEIEPRDIQLARLAKPLSHDER